MPNINDLSNYLRQDDIKAGDLLCFVNAGVIVQKDFSKARNGSDKKTVLEITVRLPDGKEKVMTPNKTSRTLISAAFGVDTAEWVDKYVEVNYIEQLSFGELKKIMVLKPVERK